MGTGDPLHFRQEQVTGVIRFHQSTPLLDGLSYQCVKLFVNPKDGETDKGQVPSEIVEPQPANWSAGWHLLWSMVCSFHVPASQFPPLCIELQVVKLSPSGLSACYMAQDQEDEHVMANACEEAQFLLGLGA